MTILRKMLDPAGRRHNQELDKCMENLTDVIWSKRWYGHISSGTDNRQENQGVWFTEVVKDLQNEYITHQEI